MFFKIFGKIIGIILRSLLILMVIIAVFFFTLDRLAFSKGSVTVNACIVELNKGTKHCNAKFIYQYLGRYYLSHGNKLGACEGKFSVGDVIFVDIAMKHPERSHWNIPDVKVFLTSSQVDSIKMLYDLQENKTILKE